MAETAVLPEGQEFFKLNDVCKLANVQPYMLRFWGTEFPQLEAQKTGTGQRLYDREQVGLILEIRRLLFDEGLTIAGARKRLAAAEQGEAPAPRKPVRRTAAAAKRARRTTEDFDDDEAPEGGDEDQDEDGEHLEGASPDEGNTSPAPVAAPRPRRPPAAAAPSPVSRAEVDKAAASRVQPLLATLQDVREEIASIVAELRAGG